MAHPITSSVPALLQTHWAGVCQRDRASLTALYRLLYNDLLSFGIRYGHDGDTAKDAVNQIFLELWENAQQLPAVDNVRSYLLTYLRRKLLRAYEHESRHSELTGLEPMAERSYEEILIGTQQEEHTRERLRQALATLTPRQKELIDMRFFRNMTNEAIAETTGMHINTVYNTISAALKTLRQHLNQAEYVNFALWVPLLGTLLGASVAT